MFQDNLEYATSLASRTERPMVFIGINGRYLSQPMTGVQRYATNMVGAIDRLICDEPEFKGLDLCIFCDSAAESFPKLERVTFNVAKFFQGYFWEQLILPFKPMDVLVSLGNMGPVLKSRQLLVIHDTNVFDVPDSYGRAYRTAYAIIQPVLARRSAKVVTVSQFSWTRILAHDLVRAEEAGLIAANGHDHVHNWKADASGLDLTLDRPYILIVGSYARHKNFATVLASAVELDRAGIDIVVAGTPGTVFSDVPAANAGDNIKFLGRVSDDTLCWLYRHAAALAIPSIQEGFGLPALEAMALGCPVVSSTGGSLKEVCGNAAIYLDPMDKIGWQRELALLVNNEHRRSDMIAQGYEQASKFHWQDSARQLLRWAIIAANSKAT